MLGLSIFFKSKYTPPPPQPIFNLKKRKFKNYPRMFSALQSFPLISCLFIQDSISFELTCNLTIKMLIWFCDWIIFTIENHFGCYYLDFYFFFVFFNNFFHKTAMLTNINICFLVVYPVRGYSLYFHPQFFFSVF